MCAVSFQAVKSLICLCVCMNVCSIQTLSEPMSRKLALHFQGRPVFTNREWIRQTFPEAKMYLVIHDHSWLFASTLANRKTVLQLWTEHGPKQLADKDHQQKCITYHVSCVAEVPLCESCISWSQFFVQMFLTHFTNIKNIPEAVHSWML